MIRHFFITALRNIWRSKAFSAINIITLSLGLACCMLIFLYVMDEAGYDSFHINAANICHLVTIFISCIGLFGLATLSAERRKKEIGIRKVLGASVQGITALLSLDFVKLVVLSILIASPFTWWAISQWLQKFAYKISISWWIFAAAGLGAIVMALLTVSFQSAKAALANPIKSLRSE